MYSSFTAQKLSIFGVILVRIFPPFSRIRAEYGEILPIFLYSVQMSENVGKVPTRITPNTDTFYVELILNMEHLVSANDDVIKNCQILIQTKFYNGTSEET